MTIDRENKKPLKVLFVTHKHPPSLGGMQRQSFELIRNYRKLGEASTVRFDGRYPIWVFFVIVVPWVAIKLAAERDVDLIHGNDGLMAVFLTPFLLTRKKLFATIHGVDIVNTSVIYQWWVSTFLRRFAGIIAVSERTANECIARGIASEKVTYIPNACDPVEFNGMKAGSIDWLEKKCGVGLAGKVLISSVGRAVPRKGFTWFASQVLPHLPDDVVYVVVSPKEKRVPFFNLLKHVFPDNVIRNLGQSIGIGTDYTELERVASSGALKGKIRIIERLTHDELIQLYVNSKIFVMPNLKVAGDFEGFGLVAQEAVSSGALCIAANVDGIPSAIRDGETGILLPSHDAPAWIQAISDLCADRRALEAKARSFQKTFRSVKYSWMDMARRYRDYFERASSRDLRSRGGAKARL